MLPGSISDDALQFQMVTTLPLSAAVPVSNGFLKRREANDDMICRL